MKIPALAVTFLFLGAAFAGIFRHIVKTPVDISAIAPTRIEKSKLLTEDWSIASPDAILGNAEISATLARPLFSRDRRRFVPPREPELQSGPAEKNTDRKSEASELVLLGVSLGGGQSRALVAGPGSSGNWVQPGDTVQSWIVEEIRPNEVGLTRGSEKAELKLYPQSGE